MTEKASADVSFASQNENAAQAQAPEVVDAAAGRQSLALNIVENPLQVSFVISGSSQPPVVISSIGTDCFIFPLTARFQGEDGCRCAGFC